VLLPLVAREGLGALLARMLAPADMCMTLRAACVLRACCVREHAQSLAVEPVAR
jgi:hypothetical protein